MSKVNFQTELMRRVGFPQGSVLGPILFVIFINDMPNFVQSSCKLFVDDAKIYTSIKTNYRQDITSRGYKQWSHKWNLPFNEEKCKNMRIGKESTAHTYQMNGHELVQVEEEKDLGVIIDKKDPQISYTHFGCNQKSK